jgi:dUTP pyrophosphatase
MKLLVQKLHPDAILPKYALPGDAGLDLFSLEKVVLAPQQKAIVKTGIAIALPPGHAGLIWDKSGMAAKFHLHVIGGVFDETYRGEYTIILVNLGENPYTIEKGSKIAQLLIQPILQPEVVEVPRLDDTVRGGGKFGSTGLQ